MTNVTQHVSPARYTTHVKGSLLPTNPDGPAACALAAAATGPSPGLNPADRPVGAELTAPCLAPAAAARTLPNTVPAKLEASADLAAAVAAGPEGLGDLPLGAFGALALGDLAFVLPGGLPTGLPVLVGAFMAGAAAGSTPMVLRRTAEGLPAAAAGGGAVAGVTAEAGATAELAAAVPAAAAWALANAAAAPAPARGDVTVLGDVGRLLLWRGVVGCFAPLDAGSSSHHMTGSCFSTML